MSPRHAALLAVGVVAVSFAAIFIRYADASGLTIAESSPYEYVSASVSLSGRGR